MPITPPVSADSISPRSKSRTMKSKLIRPANCRTSNVGDVRLDASFRPRAIRPRRVPERAIWCFPPPGICSSSYLPAMLFTFLSQSLMLFFHLCDLLAGGYGEFDQKVTALLPSSFRILPEQRNLALTKLA